MNYKIIYEILPMRAIHEVEINTDKKYKAIEALNAWAESKDVQVRIISTELIEF